MMILYQLRQYSPYKIKEDDFLAHILLVFWILTMIFLPIARWIWGDNILPTGINIATLFQASAVSVIVQKQWGISKTVQSLLIISVITWGAEVIGHNTGFPFGDYHHTDVLQPQLAGVPLLIPVAWFMLLPSVAYHTKEARSDTSFSDRYWS